MKKIIFKSFTIMLIFLLLSSISAIYATDINMNLANSNSLSNNLSNTNSNSITNSTTNSTANTQYSANVLSNSSTIISNGSSTEDSTLGLPQILNILLIVVGVVLILLAIAILIRIKS